MTRFAFAGDRDISVWVLDFLLAQGVQPLALLVPDPASHADELINRCTFLESDHIFRGKAFDSDALRLLDLDYIIAIHFPYIVPPDVLAIPKHGVVNLHPAFLPYNRGWHTPTWALLEDTPIGATLHFMESRVDAGDIIHQQQLIPSPGDTAHTLYQRLKLLELAIFKAAWADLASGTYTRIPQNLADGNVHKRQELFTEAVQKIDLDEKIVAGDLLRRLRALTTNDIHESAYFETDGRRYRVQVIIQEES